MITIEDLSSVINSDVLNDLFIQRNEEIISSVSKEDEKNLKIIYEKKKQSRQKLTNSFNTLLNCSAEDKKQLFDNIENHIEISSELSAYFDEKLYKSGVLDGLALHLKSIKK